MSINESRDGFSLVEVILAMLILTVGVLAMGASTGFIMAQIRAAELRTERMAAVRQAAETLRGVEWSALDQVCSTESFTIGAYDVTCSVTRPSTTLARVQLVSTGPAYRGARLERDAAETTGMSLPRPQ